VRGFKPRSKTFSSSRLAEEWGKQQEAELLKLKKSKGTDHDFGAYTIRALCAEFLAEPKVKKQRGFSNQEFRLGWWVNAYGNTRVLDINAQTLRKARTALSTDPESPRGPATVNRYLSSLRAAWNFGLAAELIPASNPWPKQLLLPEPDGRVRFLNADEISAVLKAAEADPVVRCAIMVSIGTGIRQGELIRLTWADIDLVKGHLAVHLSKSGRRRTVHIPANAVEALRALKKLPIVSPVHVFLNSKGKPLHKGILEYRWRAIRTAAKLKDARWHDLRHTCASILAQNGATLMQIAGVLGHSSPAMTMRYSHLVQGAAVTGHDELNKLLK
jgi:integrase